MHWVIVVVLLAVGFVAGLAARGLFRAAPAAPREVQSFPRRGFVAVVSAELQDWEFIRRRALARDRDHLRLLTASDGTTWLSDGETRRLLEELTTLLANGVGSAEDRLAIRRAAALVEHGLDTGTGIAVSAQ